jgi:hypothetical protein
MGEPPLIFFGGKYRQLTSLVENAAATASDRAEI